MMFEGNVLLKSDYVRIEIDDDASGATADVNLKSDYVRIEMVYIGFQIGMHYRLEIRLL